MQLQVLVKTFDRGDFVKQLVEALLDEPTKRKQLDLNQPGQILDILDSGVRLETHSPLPSKH
jgi:hypothetical protein